MKFNADQAHADRKASVARRTATQALIQNDQQSSAKRDAKALRAEAVWFAKQAKKA